MTTDPVGALRRERSELLRLCRDLSDEDWQRQSAAAGWRVQDVVANMGSAYRALVGPATLELMRSNDIERTNDALVDQRRDWLPTRVIAEYERWSQVMLRLIGPVSRTPLARAPMRPSWDASASANCSARSCSTPTLTCVTTSHRHWAELCPTATPTGWPSSSNG